MSAAYYVAAFFIIAAGLYTVRRYRQNPTPAMRAFAATLFLLATAFIVLANATRPIIDDIVHLHPFARWVGNALTIAAGASLNVVLSHFARRPTDPPPPTRRYALAVTASFIAMGICVLGTPDNDDFVDVYATDTSVTAYLLIYLASIGAVMTVALISGIRYARDNHGLMRAAMTFVATGAGFGIAYSLYKLGVVAARYEGHQLGTESIIGPVLGLAAALLITIGSTLGSWVPATAAAIRRRVLYRQLAPLHTALAEAFPEITLDVQVSSRRYRLDRRVVEIGDGLVRLRPWSDRAALSAKAVNLRQDHELPVVQAMIVTAALRARADGIPPADPCFNWLNSSSTTPTNLEGEAAHLAGISRAFTSLPADTRLPEVTVTA
ncbi:MAB_1171c family putative transporter [Actinomadura litoris]|uniref:MAB_1171c family putative transporter n=1 Tax=Actinomadura litoris TaxID=2678616 RepID=UPI001FA6B2C0|nr:MAB_1171c family putative transporter [Actinomadura litoris]